MTQQAESKRAQLSRPNPALVPPWLSTVCHGIATSGHGTATVACKSSRERRPAPYGTGGSPS
jgi:hypothetical protein